MVPFVGRWFVLYLLVSVEAIALSSNISQMKHIREKLGKDVASLDLEPGDVEEDDSVLAHAGISRDEFQKWGIGKGAEFDKIVGIDDLGQPKKFMSYSQFQAYSNQVGKTPSAISIQEYPLLIRRVCESPQMFPLCVTLGPYHIAQVHAFLTLGVH